MRFRCFLTAEPGNCSRYVKEMHSIVSWKHKEVQPSSFVVACNRPTADRVYLHITEPVHNFDLQTGGETYVRSRTHQEHWSLWEANSQQSRVNTTGNVHNITYKSNMRPFRFNARCRWKAIRMTYSECTPVALVIQHSKRMQPTIPSSVACPDLAYFSTLSSKWHDFSEECYRT